MHNGNPLHALDYTVWNWCMKNCQPRTALDIGANNGGYANMMLQSGFNVHCFEPVPDMFVEMHKNIGGREGAVLVNCGIGEQEEVIQGVTVFSAWTIAKPNEVNLSVCPDYKDKPTFDMRVTTIDAYVAENALHVGFIKLDVDGYEMKALKGGENTIRTQKPPMLIELGQYISFMGTDPQDFVNYIFDLGYDIVSMDGKYIAETWEHVRPYYPYQSTFDVMLLPKEKTEQICAHFA